MGSTEYSTSPTKENESPFDMDSKRSPTTVASPSVGGDAAPSRALSWQRRPTSQTPRPLSMFAAENAAARSSSSISDPAVADPAEPPAVVPRDQIAQALSSKDPSWFRQTPDRGQNSAAYRRSQVEDEARIDVSAARTELPGMSSSASSSRATSVEPEKSAADCRRPSSPAIHGTVGSPFTLAPSQRLDPPNTDGSGDNGTPSSDRKSTIMSPPLGGRTSPTRPLSPTKGMGGFVQSAMMKRTDSVKRWSVNSPQGLQRADSIAASTPQSRSRPTSMYRESTSRPTSSHGKEETVGLGVDEMPSGEGKGGKQDGEGKGSGENKEEKQQEGDRTTPPTSPSKTMDPRRWSPSKSSSWLEAALNKPESPKPKPTPPMSSQPSWMVELNKAKAQKANNPGADVGRTSSVSHKHEVKVGGLLRSTPMGSGLKPTPLGGSDASSLHSQSSSVGGGEKLPISSLRSSLHKPVASDERSEETNDETASKRAFSANGRPKPETPPKKDFRANLKTFQPPPASAAGGDASELKNVFGALRKTKTQNYVAPDEFKDNIMRGKAALNVTGGPKPSVIKDEFKDAILQKKAEFKQAQLEGRGITRNASESAEKPIPEGLAKKLELGRANTVTKTLSSSSDAPREPLTRVADSSRLTSSSTLPARETLSLPKVTDPVVPPNADSGWSSLRPKPQLDATATASPPPFRAAPKVGGGKLADRFNPALAGLLARGPPGIGPSPGKGSADSSGTQERSARASETEPPAGPGPQLTHMTKGRARGPKRKAPTTVCASAPVEKEPKSSSPPEVKPKPVPPVEEKPAGIVSVIKTSLSKAEDAARNVPAETTLGSPTSNDSVPPVDSSRTMADSPASPTKKIHEQVAGLAALGKQAAASEPSATKCNEPTSQPSSPKKLDMKRMSKFFEESSQKKMEPEPLRRLSPSKTGGRWQPSEAETPRPLSPQKTGGRRLPEPPVASHKPKQSWDGNAAGNHGGSVKGVAAMFQAASSSAPATEAVRQDPTESGRDIFRSRSRSPTKSSVRPLPVPPPRDEGLTSPSPLASPARSPTKNVSEVTMMLNEFFGPNRPKKRDYKVDAAEVLMRKPPLLGPKIHTESAQLFRIGGDSKKQAVPAHQERVLFEREMYLCPHTFIDERSGRKVSEVYFWYGDEVSPLLVEDAYLFVSREARSYGGRLVVLPQGKETPEFIQALGGIVIIRRGSSNKYDSLAPHMLCGRRYQGQMMFDEVDFSPNSLCSGFPYLITQGGKCHLWKGKGAEVDELGCARLIGMDSALMGELIEVDDGEEPTVFWDIFEGVPKAGSADHWRLKPNYQKYSGRLFRSDAESREQIIEIFPFSQADLDPTGIYILDAFFEMYIVVGYGAQSQYASFRNALDFAQEYAILASGMEDRPFVPISTVVLEGIPRDMKSVFRKWRDAASPTRTNVGGGAASTSRSGALPSSATSISPAGSKSPGLKRARSLRIVPLNQALLALAD